MRSLIILSGILLPLCAALCSCGTIFGTRTMETIGYPAELRETRLQVTGFAKFSGDKDWRYVTIKGMGFNNRQRITWLPTAPDPDTLDSTVPWKFELLVQSGGIRERLGWSEYPEIAKVTIEDKTVFDASICEVHRIPMDREIELKDIFAGRLMPPTFSKARRTEFPHSGTDFPSCTFWQHSTLTWRCNKCFAAAERWCKKNASNAPHL